jgi:hypothetical protein
MSTGRRIDTRYYCSSAAESASRRVVCRCVPPLNRALAGRRHHVLPAESPHVIGRYTMMVMMKRAPSPVAEPARPGAWFQAKRSSLALLTFYSEGFVRTACAAPDHTRHSSALLRPLDGVTSFEQYGLLIRWW